MVDRINEMLRDYKITGKLESGVGETAYSAVKTVKTADGERQVSMTVRCIAVQNNELNEHIKRIQLIQSAGKCDGIVHIDEYKPVENAVGGYDIIIIEEPLTSLEKLEQRVRLDESEAVKLGRDISSSLEYCGKRGLKARNITPASIFVNKRGKYKLGYRAFINVSDEAENAYLAPEVKQSGEHSDSSCIYSLGMVMYSMLNGGKLPKVSENRPFPYPTDASSDMAELILCACDGDNAERFSSYSALLSALDAVSECDTEKYQKLMADKKPKSEPRIKDGVSNNRVKAANMPTNTQGKAETAVLQKGENARRVNNKRNGKAWLIFPIAAALVICAIITVNAIKKHDKETVAVEAHASPSPRPTAVMGVEVTPILGESAAPQMPIYTDNPTQTPSAEPTKEPTAEPTEVPTSEPPSGDLERYFPYGIALGHEFAIGLKADGTVFASGSNENGQCEVSSWHNIVQVAAGWNFSLGLKSDGTVEFAGYDQRIDAQTIANWKNIKQIAANACAAIAVDNDGKVFVAGGPGESGESRALYDVPSLLVLRGRATAVAAGYSHLLVLFEDNTVAAISRKDGVWCDVVKWTDIVQIAAGEECSFGLKADGSVAFAGNSQYGQAECKNLSSVSSISSKGRHLAYMLSNGIIGALGWNKYGQCEVERFNAEGGAYPVAAETSGWNTLVLMSDGTVRVCGSNNVENGVVATWSGIVRKR